MFEFLGSILQSPMLYQYFSPTMLSLFASKQRKQIISILQEKGFYLEDIRHCNIQSIATHIKNLKCHQTFMEVIGEGKLTHITLMKATLILLYLVQTDASVQELPELNPFINKLFSKSQKLLLKSCKPQKTFKRTFSTSKLINKVETILNGKNQQNMEQSTKQAENSIGYLVRHLIQPLLNLCSRIQANYDQVYRPQKQMNDELCWATLNVLRKYLELSKTFEEIGRYYFQEFSSFALQVLSTIDYDVKILYKRAVQYIRKSIEGVQTSIMEAKLKRLTADEEVKIRQILLMVGQIDSLNDNIRLLYVGKYFAKFFYKNGIRMPPLFRGEHIVDTFDKIIRNMNKQAHKKARKESSSSADTQTTSEDKFSKIDVKKMIVDAFGQEQGNNMYAKFEKEMNEVKTQEFIRI